MIKDWKAFRDIAFALVKSGYIPVYGEFCNDLEIIFTECIFWAQENGIKELTLLINSNGGNSESYVAMTSAMLNSGITFTGLVTGRARSCGFLILQSCMVRKAVAGAQLMFHYGSYRLNNSEIFAVVLEQPWVFARVRSEFVALLDKLSTRTGISVEILREYALLERNFSGEEAKQIGLLDDIFTGPLPIVTTELDKD